MLGDDLYDKNYAVSTLREQLRVKADQFGEQVLDISGHTDAWMRLLTTFRAIYAGVKHDRMKLPAYGGSLFNPDRFPFLEGRPAGTSWTNTKATPLPISNRTVLHLLEALQVLQVRLPGGGGVIVSAISSTLTDAATNTTGPYRLPSNKGIAFKGTSLQGIGFLLTPKQAKEILDANPDYKTVLFPYLGGKDITKTPDSSPRRWAINFFDWSLEDAEKYPICLDIVRSKVQPEREKARKRNSIGAKRADFWWRYDAQARPMYDAISALEHVWVIAQTSKYAAPARQSAKIMFDQKAIVFASSSYSLFAVLSSSFHQVWIAEVGGTLGTTISYSVADIFEKMLLPKCLLHELGRCEQSDIGLALFARSREAALARRFSRGPLKAAETRRKPKSRISFAFEGETACMLH